MTQSAKFEYRVSTEAGELIIHFDTLQDFQDSLKSLDIDRIVDAVRERFGMILKTEVREPKPGLEDVYRFTGDGYVELLKVPETKVETIGLVLFAVDPNPALFSTIARSSGVADPSVFLSKQTYQKYFTRTKEGYLLTQEGKTWILNDVLPRLRSQPPKSN